MMQREHTGPAMSRPEAAAAIVCQDPRLGGLWARRWGHDDEDDGGDLFRSRAVD